MGVGTLIGALFDGLLGDGAGPPRVVVAGGDTPLGGRVVEELSTASLPVDGAPADGVEAALADAPADVVVCPHDPPAVDGLARLERLGEVAPGTPAVVVGRDGSAAAAAEALDAGAADYASTDDGPALLVRRVAAAAERDLGAEPPRPSPDDDANERVTALLEGFNETVDRLGEADAWDDVARVTAEAANAVFDFPGTSVRLYDEEAHALESVSLGATVSDIEERPPYPVDDSPHGEAFTRGETVVDDIGAEDPYDRDVFSQTMYVPIGEYGTLSVGVEEGEFAERDVLFAELLAKVSRNAFAQAERDRQLAETAVRVSEFADEVAGAGASVTAAAEEVRTASQEVTESIDEIASGAAEQSDDLGQVLDELDDLLASVDQTATTADELARQSEAAADLAQRGTDRADASMGEMRRIEDRTDAMVEDIRDLGGEIRRVSEIAELIEGVAEQTNILALNASIEAARAGEAGEGFAVVADEIKALAEETRESTDEIAAIVEAVTDRTDRTVEEMETMQADISESVDTVADALAALERIGVQVDETDASVQEISGVVARQSETLEETVGVAERVGAVSEEVSAQTGAVAEVIRDQTAAIEDVTENAQQLERMAADLRDLTGEFSIAEAIVAAVEDEPGAEPRAAGAPPPAED